jgi:hypothetical protein
LAATPVVPEPQKVEDEVSLPARSQQGAPHAPQELLGRVVAVEFLVFGYAVDTPDRGHLDARVGVVYEVVVEGVTRTLALARPQ